MKRSLIPLLSLFVAACVAAPSTGPATIPLLERLRNPLVAERYWAEMVEHMADFFRTEHTISKDKQIAAIIEAERVRAMERVAQARALIKQGIRGFFQATDVVEDLKGDVLLRGNTLSFGTTFITFPSPSMHVFLTVMVDPRDGEFPDETALNLGPIQTAYGEQEYAVPEGQNNLEFRTVVLYDTRLERLIGFAQLSK